MNDNGIQGGQGREPREVEGAAWTFLLCILFAALLVAGAVLIGK